MITCAELTKELVEVYNTDLKRRFQILREIYEIKRTSIFKNKTRVDPYFADWMAVFTPIERLVWSDIRNSNCWMVPQYPVLNYFLDFADPYRKIGLEADGKDWHNTEKDTKRDEKLHELGWRIFRVTGKETMPTDHLEKSVSLHHDGKEEEAQELLDEWYQVTSEGVVSAIADFYYLKDFDDRTIESLNKHTLQPIITNPALELFAQLEFEE